MGPLLFNVQLTLHASAGRDVRPAAQSLSLSRQRKEPKKGDPKSATPALRFGANLRHGACGVRGGTRCVHRVLSAQTTPASQSTKRVHPAVHAPPRKHRAAGAATGVLMRAIAALGPGFEIPSGRAGRREHRRLPAAKRRDTASGVAFLLPSFLWRRKEKKGRRRAHIPASGRPQSRSNIERQGADPTPKNPSPQPSPQRGEGARQRPQGLR